MLKMISLATLALGVCVALTLRADEKSSKPDKHLIQGTWKVVERTKNGEDAPDQEVKDHPIILRFSGETVTQSAAEDGKKDEATFILEASKNPRQLTITRTGDVNPGQVFVMIYELKGDSLKLAYSTGEKRETAPADFKKADGVGTLTLERQNSAK